LTLLMPIDEPSQAGLTNSGKPSGFDAAAKSLAAAEQHVFRHRQRQRHCQSNLLRHLSIPSAEAITPLPV
jgi:hypothetical protein